MKIVKVSEIFKNMGTSIFILEASDKTKMRMLLMKKERMLLEQCTNQNDCSSLKLGLINISEYIME